MAVIGLNYDFAGYPGQLIIVWREASAPLAEVGRHVAGPFPASGVYDIVGVNPVVHKVEFWQSSNGVALDALITSWTIDASKNTLKSETFYYQVGRGMSGVNPDWSDPGINDTQLRDERLKDKNYTVWMRGTGFRVPNVEFVDRSDAGGGFDLVTIGETFSDEDWIAVTVEYEANTQPSQGGDYNGIKVINGDAAIDATFYKRKIINGSNTSGIVTLTFPFFSTIPSTRMRFSNYGGNARYVVLQFALGNYVTFNGAQRNAIYLGKDEMIELEFEAGVCYVVDAKTGYERVGVRSFADQVGINQLLLDGSSYNQADYPRLMEWINALPGSQVLTSFSAWNTESKRHLWAKEGVQFRVPDDRGMVYKGLKTFDGVPDLERADNVPGGWQDDALDTSGLNIRILRGQGGSSTNPTSTTQGFSGMDTNQGYSNHAEGNALIKIDGETLTGTRVKNTGQLAVVGI